MKIMVYSLDMPMLTRQGIQDTLNVKKAELEKDFPGIKIMVIPIHTGGGDCVDMINMTPEVSYIPYGGAASGGGGAPCPNGYRYTTGGPSAVGSGGGGGGSPGTTGL
jgi:hypothetical protein